MERYEQILKKAPVYMRNEMRLRELAGGFCGNLVSGLVWCFTTFTRPFGVFAWAQCDKRGCDVLFISLLSFSLENSPAKWVTRRERTKRQQISKSDRRKKEQWESRQNKIQTSGSIVSRATAGDS